MGVRAYRFYKILINYYLNYTKYSIEIRPLTVLTTENQYIAGLQDMDIHIPFFFLITCMHG